MEPGRGIWFCALSLAEFQDSKDDSKWNPLFLGVPSFPGLPSTALASLLHSHPHAQLTTMEVSPSSWPRRQSNLQADVGTWSPMVPLYHMGAGTRKRQV